MDSCTTSTVLIQWNHMSIYYKVHSGIKDRTRHVVYSPRHAAVVLHRPQFCHPSSINDKRTGVRRRVARMTNQPTCYRPWACPCHCKRLFFLDPSCNQPSRSRPSQLPHIHNPPTLYLSPPAPEVLLYVEASSFVGTRRPSIETMRSATDVCSFFC